MNCDVFLLQALILLQAVLKSISDGLSNASTDECLAYGYTSNLVCSSCDALSQYRLESLVDSCQRCCTEDQSEQSAVKLYPVAEIEICG